MSEMLHKMNRNCAFEHIHTHSLPPLSNYKLVNAAVAIPHTISPSVTGATESSDNNGRSGGFHWDANPPICFSLPTPLLLRIMALCLVCIQPIHIKAKEKSLELNPDIQVQCLKETRHHQSQGTVASSKEYVGKKVQII